MKARSNLWSNRDNSQFFAQTQIRSWLSIKSTFDIELMHKLKLNTKLTWSRISFENCIECDFFYIHVIKRNEFESRMSWFKNLTQNHVNIKLSSISILNSIQNLSRFCQIETRHLFTFNFAFYFFFYLRIWYLVDFDIKIFILSILSFMSIVIDNWVTTIV